MASLVITSGDQAGTYCQLTDRPLTVGRNPGRELQLLDAKVSRKHFQVARQGEEFIIRELVSLNGVKVNGLRIDGEQVLNDGDEIQVGNSLLIFYARDSEERINALNKYRVASRMQKQREHGEEISPQD